MAPELLREWRGRPVDQWRQDWALPALHFYDRVASTNDLARDLARDGAPHGTTVMAGEQTRGRGRRGAPWIAPAGSSLLLSMVTRPHQDGTGALLSLRLGMAAARAIEQVAPLSVMLKWPNDLYIDEHKIGGLLCEGATAGDDAGFVVAGIGVNIHQADDDWPAPLRGRASSIEARAAAQAPTRVEIHELAAAMIAAWLHASRTEQPRLTPDELLELSRRDILFGRPLTVDDQPRGVGQGIDHDGALRVGSGSAQHRIIAGTIRFPLQGDAT